MAGSLRGRNVLGIGDLTSREINEILALAGELKRRRRARLADQPLVGKSLALVFEMPSLRTRVAFNVAMSQLGGNTVYLTPEEIGMGEREALDDVASVMSRYFDVIAARVFSHETIKEFARHSAAPVINALSDGEHPCQALADLQTLQENFGRLNGLEVAFVGDANNVSSSLAKACAKVGVGFRIATPEGYGFTPEVSQEIQALAHESGAGFLECRDPRQAVRDANAVYTDVWTSMGHESEQQDRLAAFEGFTVTKELLDLGQDAIVLHCLPAHYGEEITREVAHGPRSAILDQAENRLHAQKAQKALVTP